MTAPMIHPTEQDVKAAVERLSKIPDAWDLGCLYPDGSTSDRMDRLENDVDAILTALSTSEASLTLAVGALEEIARLRTDLRGDFSMGSKQSDIARSALAQIKDGKPDMGASSSPDGQPAGLAHHGERLA